MSETQSLGQSDVILKADLLNAQAPSHPLQGGNTQQAQAQGEGVGGQTAEREAGGAERLLGLEHRHLVVEAVEHLAELKQVGAKPIGQ